MSLLTASDVIRMAHGKIAPHSVRHAADRGELLCTRTPGGVRLFEESMVLEWLGRRGLIVDAKASLIAAAPELLALLKEVALTPDEFATAAKLDDARARGDCQSGRCSMTSLVCIGDCHFQHTHRRNADRLRALDQIIVESLDRGPIGAWLWLGDVFHQRSSIEDRNEVAPRLQRMADVAPVVLLYGNHDQPGDLHILARLKAHYSIVVVDRPQVVHLHLATGGAAAIFALPYPHKAGLVAAGVDVQQVGTAAAPLLDALFIDAAAELRTARVADWLTLMIGHATIGGSVSSVGQPMGLERDIAIDAGLLARLGDVPKIFGHIHKPQALHGAVYAGSIGRTDWGEVEEKRYLTVDVVGGRDEITVVESHPIACPPLYHVEGELTRDGFTWRVTRGPDGEPLAPPASWAGCEVRVRYRFNADDKAVLTDLSRAQILAAFVGAAHLELDPIAVRNRAIRSTEVATATTLAEKVSAFVRQSGGAWTAALETKLALLQQPDGGAFLTTVANPTAPAAEMEEVTL